MINDSKIFFITIRKLRILQEIEKLPSTFLAWTRQPGEEFWLTDSFSSERIIESSLKSLIVLFLYLDFLGSDHDHFTLFLSSLFQIPFISA